jgi:cell division protein ZipA
MSELRWILLAAGLLLIAGIYYFGSRARRRSAPPVERTVRVDPPAAAASVPAYEPAVDNPRIEPSYSPGEGYDLPHEPDEATIDFDEPAVTRTQGRREPTLGTETTVVVQRAAPLAVDAETTAEVRQPRPPEPGPAPEPESRRQQRIVAVRVVANAPLRFEGAKLLEVIKLEGLEFGRYDIFHNLHTDGRPVFSLASLREPGTFDIGTMPQSAYPGIALFGVLPGPLPAVETFDQLIFTARALAAQLGGTLADERGAPLTVHRITRLREEMVAFDRQGAGGEPG